MDLLLPCVQAHRFPHEVQKLGLVERIALEEVNGPRCFRVEAGVDESMLILQRGAFEEVDLDVVLKSTDRADHATVRKDRGVPLPFFFNGGISIMDQLPEPCQGLT